MPSRYKSPKVRHHRLPARQQDVLRFDVAVHHVVAVGVTKGARHLARDPQGLLERQLPLPLEPVPQRFPLDVRHDVKEEDRKSTRLNSSHPSISYAVFCLKKKKKTKKIIE